MKAFADAIGLRMSGLRFRVLDAAHAENLMVFNISIKRENLSNFKRNCQIKSKLLQFITTTGPGSKPESSSVKLQPAAPAYPILESDGYYNHKQLCFRQSQSRTATGITGRYSGRIRDRPRFGQPEN
ncbi:hypothetical protein [Pseudodesulfovibrio sp.]|uniref:hypothetical protein n=1 Tax=unclassified Pseudodesulfovibrio TaxID=2661612 RepID=UPI003AFFCE6B